MEVLIMEKGNDTSDKISALFFSSFVVSGTYFSYYNTTLFCVYSDGEDNLLRINAGGDSDNSSRSKQHCKDKKTESDCDKPDSIKFLFLNEILSPTKA